MFLHNVFQVDNLLDPSRHQDLGISMQKSPNKVKFSEELNGDVSSIETVLNLISLISLPE